MAWQQEANIKGPPGADSTVPGPPGPPGPPGVGGDWNTLVNKPDTFPPTLPIPSSGVTGLDAKQAAQDAVDATKLDASAYTAADVLAKIKTVDGPGSGLDADLLDGQSGAYYLDNANSTGTLPAASFNDTTHGNRAGGTLHPAVTTSVNGFMSAADKVTFNAIPTTYAPLASPTFTGDPKAPTPATSDNDTSIATTAYVKANLATIVGGAIIADTPPGGPQAGQLWWESDSGALFLWYTDANTSQWVQVNNASAPGNTAQTRNRIVNPAMQISQELSGSTSTNATYPADQWLFFVTGITANSARADDSENQPQLYATVSTAKPTLAAGDNLSLMQRIEGIRIKDFRWGLPAARPVVLRFEIYCTNVGTYTASIRNAAADRSFLAPAVVTVPATWTTISIPVPGDTSGVWPVDNSHAMTLGVTFAAGTNVQGVAGWQTGNLTTLITASNGAALTGTHRIRNVGLYLDPDATGIPPKWVMPDEAEELRACQRYWFLAAHSDAQGFRYGAAGQTLADAGGMAFPVPMRVTPPAIAAITAPTLANCTAPVMASTGLSNDAGLRVTVTALGAYRAYAGVYAVNARM